MACFRMQKEDHGLCACVCVCARMYMCLCFERGRIPPVISLELLFSYVDSRQVFAQCFKMPGPMGTNRCG